MIRKTLLLIVCSLWMLQTAKADLLNPSDSHAQISYFNVLVQQITTATVKVIGTLAERTGPVGGGNEGRRAGVTNSPMGNSSERHALLGSGMTLGSDGIPWGVFHLGDAPLNGEFPGNGPELTNRGISPPRIEGVVPEPATCLLFSTISTVFIVLVRRH
jgi:hypothetical protein